MHIFRVASRPRKVGLAIAAILVMAGCLLGTSNVYAEPYIAIREGYKCSKCHVNITGGGKRTDFANVYAQSRLPGTIVNWSRGAPEPASASGAETQALEDALPAEQTLYDGYINDFLSIGGDLRVTFDYVDTPNEPVDNNFTLSKTLLYIRMDVVPDAAFFYIDQELSGSANSREVFTLFRGTDIDLYAKVGKFFLPSGFRLQDDTAFIRSATRFNYGVTDTGFELGMEPGPVSISFAVTNGGTKDKKYSLYSYLIGEVGLIGLSHSVDNETDSNTRRVTNLFAGFNAGRIVGMFEVDRIRSSETGIEQEALFLEFNLMLYKGANLKLTFEALDPDLDSGEDIRDRQSLVFEPFINQFLQVRGGVRDSNGPVENNSLNTLLYFGEVHVFF